MNVDDVNQSDSTVGGDQVGRDKITNITHEALLPERPFLLKELVDAFNQEVADNEELGVTIAALQHFLDTVDGPEVMGLNAKLTLANRTDELREAERFKELFARKVHRRQFSASAQWLFAYLLGDMNQRFKYNIRPLIERGVPRHEIDQSVYENVLNPIGAIVRSHNFPLVPHEVQGMLYFLTGNCHIYWH